MTGFPKQPRDCGTLSRNQKGFGREEEEYSQSTEGQLEAQMKRIAALRTQYLDEKAWVDEYDITSGSSLANLQRLEDPARYRT